MILCLNSWLYRKGVKCYFRSVNNTWDSLWSMSANLCIDLYRFHKHQRIGSKWQQGPGGQWDFLHCIRLGGHIKCRQGAILTRFMACNYCALGTNDVHDFQACLKIMTIMIMILTSSHAMPNSLLTFVNTVWVYISLCLHGRLIIREIPERYQIYCRMGFVNAIILNVFMPKAGL